MHIKVNGETKELTANVSLENYLKDWPRDLPFVVALNDDFVPASLYADTLLNDNDNLEILTAAQGG